MSAVGVKINTSVLSVGLSGSGAFATRLRMCCIRIRLKYRQGGVAEVVALLRFLWRDSDATARAAV
eukprot:scaffold23785_cov138-Isochrysis_galbana.AAC.1